MCFSMWVKSAFFVAVLCSTFTQVAAWSIDTESCDPVGRTQNIKDMVNYIMQWPDKVDKFLGRDKAVNAFAKNLFNEDGFAQVKSIINKVGTMSREDTSGTDTMDPIIYCNQKRYEVIKDVTDPSKISIKDTKHDIVFHKVESYEKCFNADGKTNAYTRQWIKNGQKHTIIQLCPRLLKENGQTLQFDGEKFNVKRINVALEFMNRMRNTPAHIDHFFPILKTLFHEFIHTWKVKDDPHIRDGDKTYGWTKCTQTNQATALNNADSYAYVAIGTWIIKEFGADISKDGVIEIDELALPKRNDWVGLPWFA